MSIDVQTVIRNTCLYKGGHFAVLMAMADCANTKQGDGIYPGIDLLAANARLEIRRTQDIVLELRRDGVVILIGPNGEDLGPDVKPTGGRGRKTEYRIDLERVQELQGLHEAAEGCCPFCDAREKRAFRHPKKGAILPVKGAIPDTKGAISHTPIEEPSIEPSEIPLSREGDDVLSLRRRVWVAFQSWPGDLPASASEASTLGALDRLADPPALGELIACIEREGEAIAAKNGRRGGAGGQLLMAPHNWLAKARGWEKHIGAVREKPTRIADGVERAQRVLAILGAETHARLRRARLNEGEIMALDGALFEPGPPPSFSNLSVHQESILRKHHPELNEIWPGLVFEPAADRRRA